MRTLPTISDTSNDYFRRSFFYCVNDDGRFHLQAEEDVPCWWAGAKGTIKLSWLTREILSCKSFEHFYAVYRAFRDLTFIREQYTNDPKLPIWMELLEKRVRLRMNDLIGPNPVEDAIKDLLDFNEQSRGETEAAELDF